ncbi:potassium channel family protein [Actinomadura madurae]|uniref:potassium channel family protein n=1 Tax=Actinomadura madurae TaxID=1993 RepID=UPI0020273475|nr:potassium channel family protein [Actinomadura madurae]MCP9949352.1 ion channel [Actinomadura madurae]MCP9966108.1 ion channel [Actinomadura madurae]MCP9978596.1 ion channel [Actinomadura madurae]MCQ0009879.1 ion channel [Actinomadura madurae]URM94900.1 ion channel [Actinomadura madurae]
MPIVLLRLVSRITGRSWRVPALVLAGAFLLGWVLIAVFEEPGADLKNPSQYVWYFLVSGTTTGYGDLAPETVGGRIGGVLIIVAGLTAGLVLFAELTLWMAKGRTMKANGQARLHRRRHVVIVGYEREALRAVIGQLRADPAYARTPVVTIFWPGQLTGENPDPDLYDVVAFDDTAYERACLEHARTAVVVGHSDDETVRVMLGLAAYLRRKGAPPVHLLAGVRDGGRRAEITEALDLISADIEPVDIDDPAVVAVAIRNPGVAAIYHNLASTLDSDGTLYRVDVPEDAGEWSRLDVAVFLLHRGSTLLAVGESHGPNARFRLTALPDERIRGGQSLAVVAPERPEIPWHEL